MEAALEIISVRHMLLEFLHQCLARFPFGPFKEELFKRLHPSSAAVALEEAGFFAKPTSQFSDQKCLPGQTCGLRPEILAFEARTDSGRGYR